MKNVLVKLVVLITVVPMLLGTSNPAVEGRASVAQPGELPPGMYVKAHSFLPGDSVLITNPSNEVSIEAFVFATIDEGVAAIVSEQVAEKLFISNDSDSLVQIRKIIAPVEVASGALPVEEEIDKVVEIVESVIVVNEEMLDDSEIYSPEDDKTGIVDTAEQDIIQAEAVIEVAAEGESESAINELASSDAVETQNATSFEESIAALSVTESIESSSENSIIVDSVLIEEVAVAPYSEETPVDDSVVFTPFSDMSALFSETTQVTEEPLLVAEEELASNTPEEPVKSIVAEENIEVATQLEAVDTFDELLAKNEAVPQVIVITPEVEIEEKHEENLVIDEVPNILTPTVEKPAEEIFFEDEPEVTLFFKDTLSEEPLEVKEVAETVDVFALTPATEYANESEFVYTDFDKYIVDNIFVDKDKKFYIQLATYRDSKNINEVLVNYGERYPLALVESPAITDAYQVVVGPLTKDEYTVVLERFKSYGYKDAFLRIAE